MSDGLRQGEPKVTRNERRGFDKYHWPPGENWSNGLELQIYDDGRVKIGGWHTSVAVVDVMNRARGNSNASGHVVVRFRPASDQDQDQEEDQG